PIQLFAGMTNSIATIAASTASPIIFLNSAALMVGTIATVYGNATAITSTNSDETLCSTCGNLTLADSINAGTATVRLDATATVSEIGAAIVAANTLGVRADGNIAMV